MSSCACRIVAQCRALRDSDTAHSESGDAEISQAHLCRQRRRLWDWSSQSRRSAVLKEHCLLAQAQLARAVRRRRHLLTETMRDAAHLCFCAIRECKGTRVKVPERASCRARVCILHFSSAHLQGRWDFDESFQTRCCTSQARVFLSENGVVEAKIFFRGSAPGPGTGGTLGQVQGVQGRATVG